MILHSVYLSLPIDADPSELVSLTNALADLVGEIDGFTSFQHGPNIDVEQSSPEAQYGFICTFNDIDALKRYAIDPRHRALGARLVALCGGVEQIKVYDIDTGDL